MLDLSTLASLWVSASKTKPMRVKHVSALLSDLDVAAHIFVRTLEGDQAIQKNSFVCIGMAGEMWQQGSANLFKRYNLVSCDENGWWTAVPKDGNVVDAMKITDAVANGGEFSVRGLWGVQADDGTFYQTGKVGDWVLRSRENPDDVWIVRGDVFDATYEVKS
jgi:hypothetical protein